MAAAPTDAKVKESLGVDKQPTLHDPTRACEEHCSATPEVLKAIDRKVGHQVRVVKDEEKGEFALYTVTEEEAPDPSIMPPPKIVRMASPGGPKRLGDTVDLPFAAKVDPECVDLTQQLDLPASADTCALLMTEEEEVAKKDKGAKFIERVCDDGAHTGLIVIAPHGGVIEQHTDDQAVRVATIFKAKGVSLWLCKGWKPDESEEGWASVHWHITSTDIHEESFPGLKFHDVISRGFKYAVSFHGFNDGSEDPMVIVGGGAPLALKLEIQLAILKNLGAPFTVAVALGGRYGGVEPENIVNRLAGGNGIQIEQNKVARKDYEEAIAGAVAGVYEPLL